MSIEFESASSDNIYVNPWGGTEINYYGSMAVSFWAKPDDTVDDATRTVWSLSKAGSTHYYKISFYTGKIDPPANAYWMATVYDGTSTVNVNYTPPSWAWQHVCFLSKYDVDMGSANWHGLYVNGVLRDYDETEMYPAALNRLYVGCRRSGLVLSEYFDGYIAELANWGSTSEEGVLSANDIAALASGYAPCLVGRATTTLWYWPLRSPNCWDLRNWRGVTNPFVASVSAPVTLGTVHPPIIDRPSGFMRPGAFKRREAFIGGVLRSVT